MLWYFYAVMGIGESIRMLESGDMTGGTTLTWKIVEMILVPRMELLCSGCSRTSDIYCRRHKIPELISLLPCTYRLGASGAVQNTETVEVQCFQQFSDFQGEEMTSFLNIAIICWFPIPDFQFPTAAISGYTRNENIKETAFQLPNGRNSGHTAALVYGISRPPARAKKIKNKLILSKLK